MKEKKFGTLKKRLILQIVIRLKIPQNAAEICWIKRAQLFIVFICIESSGTACFHLADKAHSAQQKEPIIYRKLKMNMINA